MLFRATTFLLEDTCYNAEFHNITVGGAHLSLLLLSLLLLLLLLLTASGFVPGDNGTTIHNII
jgi:hypothetical protein